MISIHQSQFLPWIPYFYKILKSDIFIIMDDVQYQKNGVQNRNKIKTPTGELWLTVPVEVKSNTLINEAGIKHSDLIKILKTIKMNYGKSRYFDQIYPGIENIITDKPFVKLNDLNIELLNFILKLLGSKTKIKFSSEFALKSTKDDLVLDLILANNEKEYITGSGGLNYMDLNKFIKSEVTLYEYSFTYAEYNQLWPKVGFVQHLSIIDLLFNEFESAHNYIISNGSIKLI